MFNKIDYAMVTVSSMDRSVLFYRDVLGFKLRFQSSEWTEFETGTTTLALHGGGKPQGRHDPDSGPRAGVASLGLNVADIAARSGKADITNASIVETFAFIQFPT